MQDEKFSAALSGLIHDSGKILQRASDTPTKRHESMVDEAITVHATWTNAFVEDMLPEFRKFARPGVYHHQPNNSDVENNATVLRVAIADKLSASERDDSSQREVNGYPQNMVSVFDHIYLDRKPEPSKKNHFLPLKPLALDPEVIFPKEPGTQTRAEYQVLANLLIKAAQADFDSRESYLENLLSAFQQYTWCIPSAYYYNLPDISLYDHARTTAALAVCLTDFDLPKLKSIHQVLQKSFKNKTFEDPLLNEPVALLIGGDISGIQDFIYTITAKEAARTLRGRSFYLQLLTEALLRYLLRALDLPYSNVIYASGGHFFLLAPLSVASQLTRIQKEISEKMLRYHGTGLYLALGWTDVPVKGFEAKKFPDYWGKMHQELQTKKHQKYTELEDEQLARIFTPDPHGGNQEQLCSVCGREHPKTSLQNDSEEAGDQIRVCSFCRSFADQIGRKLPVAKQIHLGFLEPVETQPDSAFDVLKGFGMQVAFDADGFEGKVSHHVVWLVDDPKNQRPEVADAVIWNRYVVNELAGGKTFDQLQNDAQGISRLGVLRMDVDHLGKIFKEGLVNQSGKPIGSLARLSMLSFQVSLFFEGWVKKIIQSEHYKGLVYAVYSGGDDLFLLGPWHMMPLLAFEVKRDLQKFTGMNPDINISGGLAFIHGKYPIHEAAQDAGGAETRSKLAGRNRFTFLDVTHPWDRFMEIEDKKNQLCEIMNHDGARGILQLLQRLGQMESKAQAKSKGKRVWGPWMWQTDYYLSRTIQRTTKSDLKALLERLYQRIRDEMYDQSRLQDWGTAARWTQLIIRK